MVAIRSRTRRRHMARMQEARALFFKAQQLHVNAGVIPAERAAIFRYRIAVCTGKMGCQA